jgi:cellulose synthase/poly-beta-1,6-N-acetylglucosamine synthase-like glycosyltransferase
MIIIFLLLITGFFSFGILGLNLLLMKGAAKKPWCLKIDETFRPSVSIIVPTYNEAQIIRYKLENLSMLNYQKNLMQIVVIDSQSEDGTVDKIKEFIKRNHESRIEIFVEGNRKGKAAALNVALSCCKGDVIIVSDADCFWPPDILMKALPFLADPCVGAVSGPKVLLNSNSSNVALSEDSYLNLMNLVKLGESKIGSTLLFEGGFSAYKKGILEGFDPFMTGSDDCGTVIDVIRQGYRAIIVPEASFYTAFPVTWVERIEIKVRRAVQIIKVMKTYATLFLKNKIRKERGIILKNLFLYLVAPFAFLLFAICTLCLFLSYPQLILLLLIFLIPKLRFYLIEAITGYIILMIAIILCVLGRNFLVWKKPQDRTLITREMLIQKHLIEAQRRNRVE